MPSIPRRFGAAACLVIVGVLALPSPAQVTIRRIQPWYYGGVITPYGYSYALPPGNYGGQTAYSANAAAMSEMIRAQGEYNRASAEAMRHYEEARGQYIENKQAWLAAYHEHRRQGAARREVERAEDRARRERAREAAQQREPELLTRDEYNAITGELYFPAVLQEPAFDAERERLQSLFTIRANSGATQELNDEMLELSRQMHAKLKQQIHSLSPPDYIAADLFLDHVRNVAVYGT